MQSPGSTLYIKYQLHTKSFQRSNCIAFPHLPDCAELESEQSVFGAFSVQLLGFSAQNNVRHFKVATYPHGPYSVPAQKLGLAWRAVTHRYSKDAQRYNDEADLLWSTQSTKLALLSAASRFPLYCHQPRVDSTCALYSRNFFQSRINFFIKYYGGKLRLPG
jgi:hypothetical protein